MLQKGFFRVQPFSGEALLFEKNTYGEFSYTIPREYQGKPIHIVISGAGGGRFSGVVNQQDSTTWYGGNAELYEHIINSSSQNIISGIIGQAGLIVNSSSSPNGGQGYNNGSSGTYASLGMGLWNRAGGGGGSSSLIIDTNFIYEACGGGGTNYVNITGGKGGGPRGGKGGQSAGNGKGAKGSVWQRGNISVFREGEDGYVKIYLLP